MSVFPRLVQYLVPGRPVLR